MVFHLEPVLNGSVFSCLAYLCFDSVHKVTNFACQSRSDFVVCFLACEVKVAETKKLGK